MTSPTPLFTADDLSEWLGKDVSDLRAAAVERVVWGWLQPILGLDRSDEVTPQVFSWALELGAIAHENPSGMTRSYMGPFQTQFSSERRLEILAAAEGGTSGSSGRARGSFPPAQAYPDPARAGRW